MPPVKIPGVELPEGQKDQQKNQPQVSQTSQAPAEQKPADIILDGEGIPEPFRGKPAKEVVDKLLETNLEVEKLRTQLEQERATKQQVAPAKAVEQMSEEELKAQMEREFFSNPVEFQNKLFQERMKPLVSQFYQSQEQVQKEFARKRLDDFDKYEKDVDGIMKNVPPELKANPQTWDLAYNIVLGQEYKKQLKEAKAKSGMFTETGSAPKSASAKPVLTEEERSVAAKFGMTEEQWAEWKTAKEIL
jgi:hypothetical protein